MYVLFIRDEMYVLFIRDETYALYSTKMSIVTVQEKNAVPASKQGLYDGR